jgi:hypothetical protein
MRGMTVLKDKRKLDIFAETSATEKTGDWTEKIISTNQLLRNACVLSFGVANTGVAYFSALLQHDEIHLNGFLFKFYDNLVSVG